MKSRKADSFERSGPGSVSSSRSRPGSSMSRSSTSRGKNTTTNDFFDRMSKTETFATAGMKGLV